MSIQHGSTDETTALLNTKSNVGDQEPAQDLSKSSAFELKRTKLIVAVAFTWLASFLAALGKYLFFTLPLLQSNRDRQYHHIYIVSNYRI